MTPTVEPVVNDFRFQGSYTLQSGNRLTIEILAKRVSTEEKLQEVKYSFSYGNKETRDDVKEARHHLNEALAECGLNADDLDQPKKAR